MSRRNLDGYKEIAGLLEETIGVPVTPEAVRNLARRPKDPLPVRTFGSRIVGIREELEAWIARQWGQPGRTRTA